MEIIRDETEFTDIGMVQKVVGMFESHPDIQRIVRLGLLASMNCGDELDVTREEDYKYDSWVHGHNNSCGYPRLSDRKGDRGLDGNRTRSPSSYQLPLHYDSPACDLHCPPSVEVQAKESDSESRARLLQEAKKSKCKAEKKRLKKQKQKERKQLEKLQKEKQSSVNNEEGEDDVQQSKAGERKPVNNTNSSDKHLASAQATDSCGDKSSDEDRDTRTDSDKSEELDMKSTFVSKAALIARRKLEQIPRPERREKMIPAREEPKTTPNKPPEDQEVGKKDSAVHSSPTFKDNIKISTDLANIGNRFASAGDFNMAVKYFTDAIKYNPTEFKLFGNRSFCFEKMQEYEKALTDAELSLSICPGWVKGLFRKGRALAGLKRYEEASRAFMEVLRLDSSCAEANQELKRVQITQLMRYGFTWEQSSNALVIHGTVEKALEVLSKLNHQPGRNTNDTCPPAQTASVTGVSPVGPPQPQNAAKTPLKNKPLGLVQNIWNAPSQPQPIPNRTMKTNYVDRPPQELFPIWVGNLGHSVSESVITDLFSKIGAVYSVKVLTNKRCAFVNFTKQEYCDEAIWRFNGYELNGIKIAVRYPDRIPQGMGISKYALKADDLQKEDLGPMEQVDVRNVVGSQRPIGTCRHVANCRGNKKI